MIAIIHSTVCSRTGPQRLPKRVLHRVRSSASSFIFQYPLVSLRSSSSCLRFLSLFTIPSILHSITCLFQQAVPRQGMTNPVSLSSVLFL